MSPPDYDENGNETKIQNIESTLNPDSSEVVALSWDILLGFSQNFATQQILRYMAGKDQCAPTSIDHVGIYAFGTLYEYGDFGILRTKITEEHDPEFIGVSRYPVRQVTGKECVGKTTKTKEEFEDWVMEQQIGKFKSSDYDVVKYNCIVWAILACEFLGVPYPENWDRIQMLAKTHRKLATLFGSSITTARHVLCTVEVVFPMDNFSVI